MGLKFNPPPGWPVPYDFDPPPGWEPYPWWPPPPPGWPLWIGSQAPRAEHQTRPRDTFTERYETQEANDRGRTRRPRAYSPAHAGPAGVPGNRRRAARPWAMAATAVVGLVVLAGVGVAARGSQHSPSAGPSHIRGRLEVFALQVGKCFESPPAGQLMHDISLVKSVPCRIAHNAQVFARFQATDPGSYPGRAVLSKEATLGCRKRLAAIERPQVPSGGRMIAVYPDRAAWSEGRREISCVLRAARSDLTASLLKPSAGRRDYALRSPHPVEPSRPLRSPYPGRRGPPPHSRPPHSPPGTPGSAGHGRP